MDRGPLFRLKLVLKAADTTGSFVLKPMKPPPHRTPSHLPSLALLFSAVWLLAGCDQLGIESAATTVARKEAEGKAVGAGCRHAARSVEQCYVTNKRADKAAVFAGWKEMNDYMRENKIEAVPPPPPPPVDPAVVQGEVAGGADKARDAPSGAKGVGNKH